MVVIGPTGGGMSTEVKIKYLMFDMNSCYGVHVMGDVMIMVVLMIMNSSDDHNYQNQIESTDLIGNPTFNRFDKYILSKIQGHRVKSDGILSNWTIF